jgi:hypothetical protein
MESKDLFGGNILEYLYTLEVESSGLQLPGPHYSIVCKPLSGTIVRVGIKFWEHTKLVLVSDSQKTLHTSLVHVVV